MKTSHKILIASTTFLVLVMMVFSGLLLIENDKDKETEETIKTQDSDSEKIEASLYYTTFKFILNFPTLKGVN